MLISVYVCVMMCLVGYFITLILCVPAGHAHIPQFKVAVRRIGSLLLSCGEWTQVSRVDSNLFIDWSISPTVIAHSEQCVGVCVRAVACV